MQISRVRSRFAATKVATYTRWPGKEKSINFPISPNFESYRETLIYLDTSRLEVHFTSFSTLHLFDWPFGQFGTEKTARFAGYLLVEKQTVRLTGLTLRNIWVTLPFPRRHRYPLIPSTDCSWWLETLNAAKILRENRTTITTSVAVAERKSRSLARKSKSEYAQYAATRPTVSKFVEFPAEFPYRGGDSH